MGKAEQVVEEVQGLFGPFQFSELLLQRIWSEQSFNRQNLRAEDGSMIRIRRPGRWNRQGGPDFGLAEIEFDKQMRHGDIEMHLREPDWNAHQHASDSAYDDVMLHVVLFPTSRRFTRGGGGRRIPILVLLPHLWHDLEEYAADAAVSVIAQRPADRLAQMWRELSPEECRKRIVVEARKRWQSKVRYARLRIDKLDWHRACHHTALEILGYRFNRVPMLTVATVHPLEQWIAGRLVLDEVFESERGRWQLSGVRPANHPRRRLTAYGRWVSQGGDWPSTLRQRAQQWPVCSPDLTILSDIAKLRKGLGLKSQWQQVMHAVGIQGAVSQPRADNLWGDGLLPLMTAEGSLDDEVGFLWWLAGWPGDQAANLAEAARIAEIADGRRNPLAWGHVQGLIGHQLAAAQTAGRGT